MKGFTVTELLVVMAIIVIFVAVALPVYLGYRHRAIASSYILPIVRSCLIEVEVECTQGSWTVELENPVNDLPSCRSPEGTRYGNVSLFTLTPFSCNSATGKLIGGTLKGEIGELSYRGVCFVSPNGDITCKLEGK